MQPLPVGIVGSPFSLQHLAPTRDIAMVLYDVFTSDFDNMRFWLRGEKIKSVDVVLRGIKRAYESGNMNMYYILDKEQKTVGEIGFASIMRESKSVYVDYWLMPEFRGRGLIDRFLWVMEELAFDVLKVDRVLLGIDAENLASRGVAERNGYVLNGVSKSGKVWVDGSKHDECEYVKQKSEWLKENRNA